MHQLKAMLIDTIKRPDVSWDDAKLLLQSDPRWDMLSNVDDRVLEDVFLNHVEEVLHIITIIFPLKLILGG